MAAIIIKSSWIHYAKRKRWIIEFYIWWKWLLVIIFHHQLRQWHYLFSLVRFGYLNNIFVCTFGILLLFCKKYEKGSEKKTILEWVSQTSIFLIHTSADLLLDQFLLNIIRTFKLDDSSFFNSICDYNHCHGHYYFYDKICFDECF